MLGGKDCRFGLPEFTLITGLNSVSDTSNADDMPKSEMSGRLVEQFFPREKPVKVAALEKAFRDSTNEDDVLKLGLCYLIEGVFCCKEKDTDVSENVLSLVEDLDLFYSFPWGIESWKWTVKSLNKNLQKYDETENANKKKGCTNYIVKGFAPALQYWAYEVIPEIATVFGVYEGSQTPKMLSWSNNTVVPRAKRIALILNKNKLEVHEELRPRPEQQSEERDEKLHTPITEGQKNQSSDTSTLRPEQENGGGKRKEKLCTDTSRFDQDNTYREVKRYKPLNYGQAEHAACPFCHSSKISEENYHMLCPSHSSVRFPKEKANPGENVSNWHAMPAIGSCQQSGVAALPDKDRKWLLCGSDLPIEEMSLLVKFAKIDGCSVTKFWDPNVTHVIAATDESAACTRTLKVLMAILNGRWIVKMDWIKACIKAMSHVEEEPFEISLDNYGRCDGPKNGRLRASNNGPKLLSGLDFYFVGDFRPSYRKDLEDLVIAGGGTLIKSREELSGQSCDAAKGGRTAALIIYNLDPLEGSKPGEEALIMWRRLSEAEDVAKQSRSTVIGHTWLLESIAAYKLQPFA